MQWPTAYDLSRLFWSAKSHSGPLATSYKKKFQEKLPNSACHTINHMEKVIWNFYASVSIANAMEERTYFAMKRKSARVTSTLEKIQKDYHFSSFIDRFSIKYSFYNHNGFRVYSEKILCFQVNASEVIGNKKKCQDWHPILILTVIYCCSKIWYVNGRFSWKWNTKIPFHKVYANQLMLRNTRFLFFSFFLVFFFFIVYCLFF